MPAVQLMFSDKNYAFVRFERHLIFYDIFLYNFVSVLLFYFTYLSNKQSLLFFRIFYKKDESRCDVQGFLTIK